MPMYNYNSSRHLTDTIYLKQYLSIIWITVHCRRIIIISLARNKKTKNGSQKRAKMNKIIILKKEEKYTFPTVQIRSVILTCYFAITISDIRSNSNTLKISENFPPLPPSDPHTHNNIDQSNIYMQHPAIITRIDMNQ